MTDVSRLTCSKFFRLTLIWRTSNMGILEKIQEIEREISRTQKNKGVNNLQYQFLALKRNFLQNDRRYVRLICDLIAKLTNSIQYWSRIDSCYPVFSTLSDKFVKTMYNKKQNRLQWFLSVSIKIPLCNSYRKYYSFRS